MPKHLLKPSVKYVILLTVLILVGIFSFYFYLFIADNRIPLRVQYTQIHRAHNPSEILRIVEQIELTDFREVGNQKYITADSENNAMLVKVSIPREISDSVELNSNWLYLDIQRIIHPYKIVFKGEIREEVGEAFPGYYPLANSMQLSFLGNSVLNSSSNELYILLFSDSRDFRIPSFNLITTKADYVFISALRFFSAEIYIYFSLVTAFLGIFYLVHYYNEAGNMADLDVAIFNFLMMIYFFRVGITPLIGNSVRFLAFTKSMIVPAVIMIVFFFIRYRGRNIPKRLGTIFGTGILVYIIFFTSFPQNHHQAELLFRISLIPAGLGILFYFAQILVEFIQFPNSMSRLLSGTVIGVVLILHDIVFMILGRPPQIWLQGIGIFALSVSIFNGLAERNSRMRVQLRKHAEITESKIQQRTMELNVINEDLKNANAVKTQFLANMSHEMRTPLNCIIGYGEYLQEKVEQPLLHSTVNSLLHESQRLQTLINQILDLSKIEKGRVQIEKIPFSTNSLFLQLCSELETLSNGTELEINNIFDPNIPEMLIGDPFRIHQIVLNLISNAVKFASSGTVSFEMTLVEGGDYRSINLKFSVEDQGVGIPPEKQEAIFDEFVQADPSITRLYGGTGLGMTIVNSLSRLMGGNINLQSRVGEGTRVEITLPLETTKEQPESEDISQNTQIPNLMGLRILIADDYEPNLEVLQLHLSCTEAALHFATDGAEAVQLAAKHHFDVIILDLHMPIMDGTSACMKIRKHKEFKNTPIIALTADIINSKDTDLRASGFSDVLIKPLTRTKLYTFLTQLFPDGVRQNISAIELAESDSADGCVEDEDIISILTESFIRHSAEDVKQLELEWKNKRTSVLHQIAHKLRGGALNIKQDRLAELLLEIESAAKNNKLTKQAVIGEVVEIIENLTQ